MVPEPSRLVCAQLFLSSVCASRLDCRIPPFLQQLALVLLSWNSALPFLKYTHARRIRRTVRGASGLRTSLLLYRVWRYSERISFVTKVPLEKRTGARSERGDTYGAPSQEGHETLFPLSTRHAQRRNTIFPPRSASQAAPAAPRLRREGCRFGVVPPLVLFFHLFAARGASRKSGDLTRHGRELKGLRGQCSIKYACRVLPPNYARWCTRCTRPEFRAKPAGADEGPPKTVTGIRSGRRGRLPWRSWQTIVSSVRTVPLNQSLWKYEF